MSFQPPIPLDVIKRRIGELRVEAEAAEDHLANVRAELAWYEDAQRLFGDASPNPDVEPSLPGLGDSPGASPNGSKPTLRQAILTVMREQPNKTWKVEAVIGELRRRDWLPAGAHGEHHTRSMMAQMHRKGQAKRIDRGRYRLPPTPKDDS